MRLRLTRAPGAPGRRRGTHPLVAATAVILGAAFITFYAFNGGLPLVSQFTLYAVVGNSVNVRSPDPVRIAGIDVGVVQGTSPDGRNTRIAFTLSSDGQPIHTDATITIRPRLFLEGGYYLQLDPGSPSAPIMKNGATIPLARSASPVQFFKVLSIFNSGARASLAQTVETLNQGLSPAAGRPLSDSGAASLKAAVPQLAPVLKETAWITQALRGTNPADIPTLLSNASSVTTTLARNTAALTGLVDNLKTTATAVDSTDGALAQSVTGVDQTLRVAPAALSAIDFALPPVARLSNALEPSLKLAPGELNGDTSAVRELAAIVAPAERGPLLRTLKATFEQLPAVLTKLGGVFPITQAVTDCLRTHVTPILDSVVPDGTLSSGRPVWQDFIHFLPGLASAAQDFDGNGYWIRLLVGVGTNTISLGNLPGVGPLLGTTPSSSPIIGERPVWQGDLPPDAFQPGAPCAEQQVPSLAATTGASDVTDVSAGAAVKPLTQAGLRAELLRMASTIGRSR